MPVKSIEYKSLVLQPCGFDSCTAGWRTFKLVRKTDLKLSGQFAECWWFYPGAYSVINVHKGAPGVFMSQHDQFDFTTVADDLYPLKNKI